MEKLDQITLGGKSKIIQYGPWVITVIIVGIFASLYFIKVPMYTEVAIVAQPDAFYIVGPEGFDDEATLKTENGVILNAKLDWLGNKRYKLKEVSSESPQQLTALKESYLSGGKIFLGHQSLFFSLFPFL